MTFPRIIIYAKPDELVLAARMAKRLQEPDYQWPKDGVAIFSYGDDHKQIFAARRNITGFTIYSQQAAQNPR